MKYLTSIILAFLNLAIISNLYATDEHLSGTLEALKGKMVSTNKIHPNLPTEEDFSRLEESLFEGNGGKLPTALKQFHLKLGNLEFFGIEFPTAHSTEQKHSAWHDFIRKGHEKKIPREWVPFGLYGSDYVCMHLGTGKVCLFYGEDRMKKDENEYQDLGESLKAFLLGDN